MVAHMVDAHGEHGARTGTTSGKGGMDISTAVHPIATALCKPLFKAVV